MPEPDIVKMFLHESLNLINTAWFNVTLRRLLAVDSSSWRMMEAPMNQCSLARGENGKCTIASLRAKQNCFCWLLQLVVLVHAAYPISYLSKGPRSMHHPTGHRLKINV